MTTTLRKNCEKARCFFKADYVLFLLVWFCVCTADAALHSGLPLDGDEARLHPIVAGIPQTEAKIWDFSLSDNSGDAFDIHFNWHGDSLLSATMPSVRYDYVVNGDTLSRISSETHYVSISDTIPMIIGCGAGLDRSIACCRFASRGMAFHSEHIDACGTASVTVCGRGTLILPQGDTVRNVTLTLHRSNQKMVLARDKRPDIHAPADTTLSYATRQADTYTWRSAAFTVPLAQTMVITDSVDGSPNVRTRISSWLCPPISQPMRPWMVRNSAPNRHVDNGKGAAQGINDFPELTVCIDGDRVDVRATAAADGRVEMILTDIQGRVFASRPKSTCVRGAELSWTLDNLPSGRYILYVHQDGNEPIIEKFKIR